ncbi:hypothetical protein Hanom_Chr02g00152771 [Helianthus anomalus]
MRFHKWDSVPEDVKTFMYEKLEWKRNRGVLSQHWKNNGGKTNPRLARSNMHGDCRNQEDWNHLCDYWE